MLQNYKYEECVTRILLNDCGRARKETGDVVLVDNFRETTIRNNVCMYVYNRHRARMAIISEA